MERQRKALMAAVPATAAALTVLGALAEAKKLPDDLEQALQVPCRDGLTGGGDELTEQDGGANRSLTVNAGPAKFEFRVGAATGTVTPAKTA